MQHQLEYKCEAQNRPSEHLLRGAVFIRCRLYFVENFQSMVE